MTESIMSEINYTTTSSTGKGKLDEQLANIKDSCPKTVDAIDALPKKEIQPKARQHIGYRSVTPIARLLRSWFERHGHGDNVLARVAGEILMSLICNQYRQNEVAIPDLIYRDKIPAALIMSKLTGHDYKTCKKNRSIQHLSGAFFQEVIEPLTRIEVETRLFGRIPLVKVETYSYKYHQPREYDILGLQCALAEQIQEGWKDKDISARQDYSNPSPLSADFKYKSRLKPFTIEAAEKLASAKFKLNTQQAYLRLHCWIHDLAMENCPDWDYKMEGQKAYLAKLTSMLATLSTLDINLEEQYVGSVHMTSCGRLYPEGGGIVNLPKALRWLLVGTPHPYHVLVDIDLKSCQLVALPQILDCPKTLEQVLDVIHGGKSLWEHIAPEGFDLRTGKPALKQLIYAFCFGMQVKCLRRETNKKLGKLGLDFRFSKRQIADILASPLMAPVVAARESFFQDYSLDAIEERVANKRALVVKNAVGLPFNLREHAKEVRAEYTRPDQAKVAGQLLAHLAQGAEQLVMQRFVASNIISEANDVHLINYQYDGVTLSVHMDRVNEVLEQCDEWLQQHHPEHKFEAEVLWFLKHPRFWGPRCNQMLATKWITSGRYKKLNKDPRKAIYGRTYLGVNDLVVYEKWDGERFYESLETEPPGYWTRVWEACLAKRAAA
ncbi:MAG: hypothetical protein KME14_10720 [Tildeniella torsiva UHER 1998/13D]|jgi:hypothetical protein|nr:hypothetical protein [Tildeniella torsiva UHER 1998/13D]